MPSLSEQVRELEAERDRLKANQGVDPEYRVAYETLRDAIGMDEWEIEVLAQRIKELRSAERALATAKVEGAREAFVAGAKYGAAFGVTSKVFRNADDEAARRYPAPPRASERERVCDNRFHPDTCQCRPTPQAAPEPKRVTVQGVTFWHHGNGYYKAERDGRRPDVACTLVTQLSAFQVTPTADEYAQLLALADARRIVQMGGRDA